MKKTIFLCLYFLAAAGFFLFYLFPSSAVENYLTTRWNRDYPDFRLHMGSVGPAFPPGVRFQSVGFNHREIPLLEAERLRVSPEPWSWFSGKTSFSFSGEALRGKIKGKAHISGEPEEQRVAIGADISGVRVEAIPALQLQDQVKVTGILRGDLSFASGPDGDTGNARLVLVDCIANVAVPFFDLGDFTFKQIEAELTYGNGTLRIAQSTMRGNEMDGSLSGTINLKFPLQTSVVNLTATVKPHPVFFSNLKKVIPESFLPKRKAGDNEIRFRISGSLEKPAFVLL
jgi:type II secretion system protein N